MQLRTLTVLGLLTLLHTYIGLRLLPVMPVSFTVQIVAVLWLAASVVLILAGLLSYAIRRQPLADRVAWAGLLALGMFSSLLVLTLLRDIVLLVAAIFGWHDSVLLAASAAAVPLLAAVVTAIGFINARRVARVVDVEVPIADLPHALHGFTIAQISDIHVGPTIKRGYLDAIVERVNALHADVVAVTGDLVDGSVQHLAPHTAPLARLKARHGAYFVTGNHEYYSNAHAWIAEVRRLGLYVLMNEHVVLAHEGAALLLAGVTDYSAHHFDPAHKSDPHRAVAGAPDDVAVKVLLAHQPRTAAAAVDAGFDLQLSGHTHGGQCRIPFIGTPFAPVRDKRFVEGLHRWEERWIHVTRGVGNLHGVRFNCRPEVSLLELV